MEETQNGDTFHVGWLCKGMGVQGLKLTQQFVWAKQLILHNRSQSSKSTLNELEMR